MKNSAAKTSWIPRIKKSYLPCDIVSIVRQLNMRTKKLNWLFLIKIVFVQKNGQQLVNSQRIIHFHLRHLFFSEVHFHSCYLWPIFRRTGINSVCQCLLKSCDRLVPRALFKRFQNEIRNVSIGTNRTTGTNGPLV